MRDASAPQHRALPVAQPSLSGALLRPDLAAGAVHVVAPFRGGGALARGVAFEDHGAVEDVFSEGQVEVRGWVGGVAEGFEVREGVDCCEDCGGGWWWAAGGEEEG